MTSACKLFISYIYTTGTFPMCIDDETAYIISKNITINEISNNLLLLPINYEVIIIT